MKVKICVDWEKDDDGEKEIAAELVEKILKTGHVLDIEIEQY